MGQLVGNAHNKALRQGLEQSLPTRPTYRAYGVFLAKHLTCTGQPDSTRFLCSNPRAQPDPIGESEPKPRGRLFNSFYLHFYYVFFFKSVATRISGPTRREDPNRSPVYSNVFNYLIKTFSLCYFSLGFRFARKHFQMVGLQTFTFHKMQF